MITLGNGQIIVSIDASGRRLGIVGFLKTLISRCGLFFLTQFV